MNLYIETRQKNPINHPAFEDNLLDAFGSIPSHWEPFLRVPKPELSAYQVFVSDEPKYEKVNGVWTDVWQVRDMTQEEKLAKQQATKDFWLSRPDISNYSTWSFDEDLCEYVPPIPYPEDGKLYRWDGQTNSWVEIVT